MRTGLAALATALLFAPAAHAQSFPRAPSMTVSANGVAVLSANHSTTVQLRGARWVRSTYAMLAPPLPALVVAPGDQLTITVSQRADALSASFGGEHGAAAARLDARTFRVAVPGTAALPLPLSLRVRYSTPRAVGSTSSIINLVAQPSVFARDLRTPQLR